MLRVNQIKIPVHKINNDEYRAVLVKTASFLRVPANDISRLEIVRRSIDARKKPDIFYTYTIDVMLEQEKNIHQRLQKSKDKDKVSLVSPVKYSFPELHADAPRKRVIVVGSGPAGLYCTYYLAKSGLAPLLLERGRCVDERTKDVLSFWQTGKLDTASNVQFGEGGAGTFSDGKLNTLVKDKSGRNREVLDVFVAHGAPKEILYDSKPHIGTDVLCNIVKGIRRSILEFGGSVCFESCVSDICYENGQVSGVIVNDEQFIACDMLVLAIGHSARDTFYMLHENHVQMEPKAFAVGFRVEHPQEMINMSQYGMTEAGNLGAAPYKVTSPGDGKRGVYSFCMCPGGYVVNASSEEGRLAVNGMSYSGRDGRNANSAIIIQVTPDDFGSSHPLAGISFQRKLEEKAFNLAQGKIPVQYYGDFKAKISGEGKKHVFREQIYPACKGDYAWSDLTQILPEDCNEAFIYGMEAFGRQIEGFNRPDAIMSGVESRTSSPVRILRDEDLQANIKGVFPCGEGAGYAGGITSAAMDGLRVAEKIVCLLNGNLH